MKSRLKIDLDTVSLTAPYGKNIYSMICESDLNFMRFAMNWGKLFSDCLSRGICVITTDEDRNFLSFGYNHPPEGTSCQDRHPEKKKECPRRYFGFDSGEGMVICPGTHAEKDALDKTIVYRNLFMYCGCGIPCIKCAVDIVSDGRVKRIYCWKTPGNKYSENEYHFDKSYELLTNNGITLIEIDKNYLTPKK